MDASRLSDEHLERVIHYARQFLDHGEPSDREQVRRVLQRAEDEKGRRVRFTWSDRDIAFRPE